jgi:hypothetical protein
LARISRHPFAVDGDIDTRVAIHKYKELRDWMQQAAAEQDKIKEKLAALMQEHDAQELTDRGVPVARLTEYDLETIDAPALKEKHPKLFARFTRVTPVTRVDVP